MKVVVPVRVAVELLNEDRSAVIPDPPPGSQEERNMLYAARSMVNWALYEYEKTHGSGDHTLEVPASVFSLWVCDGTREG